MTAAALHELLQPRAVIALDDDKGDVANENIHRSEEHAAYPLPQPQAAQAEHGEDAVRRLGDAGLLQHTREVGESIGIDALCRHDALEKTAHIRHLALPVLHSQRGVKLFLLLAAPEREAVTVEPLFRHDTPRRKRHNAQNRRVYRAGPEPGELVFPHFSSLAYNFPILSVS